MNVFELVPVDVMQEVQAKLSNMIDDLCKSWNMPRYVNSAKPSVARTSHKEITKRLSKKKPKKTSSKKGQAVVNKLDKVEENTMTTKGQTQDKITEWFRNAGPESQVTTEELAAALDLTKNQVKHAVARLHAAGELLRTQGRPAKWSLAPQVVQSPPSGHAAPLHGTMPAA